MLERVLVFGKEKAVYLYKVGDKVVTARLTNADIHKCGNGGATRGSDDTSATWEVRRKKNLC